MVTHKYENTEIAVFLQHVDEFPDQPECVCLKTSGCEEFSDIVERFQGDLAELGDMYYVVKAFHEKGSGIWIWRGTLEGEDQGAFKIWRMDGGEIVRGEVVDSTEGTGTSGLPGRP